MPAARTIVLGIDVGTTNIKAVAIDGRGRSLAEAALPIGTQVPQPGWVEQDPECIVAKAIACVREVLVATGRGAGEVAALGIANHTETLVVWDSRSARPVMPAIVWQCRRGAAEIEALRTPDTLAFVKARTGLDLDPTFTAAKLRWVALNRPEIADGLKTGDCLFGTVDTWLIWRLTGGRSYATEPGNASRTMLFDIDRLRFDPELLALFGLDIARLPQCMPSNAAFGDIETSIFGAAIPIRAALGDQQAALFGHGCFEEMQAKITYGTGAFLWVNAGEQARAPPDGIIRTIAWQIDRPCYAYEGFVMYAGKILEWLAERLAVAGDVASIVAEAERARTSGGAVLVPAFQGLASPWWRPDVRAALLGVGEATTIGHIGHAGLEAVCYQVRAVLDAVRAGSGRAFSGIRVDGGMTRSVYFTQLQADILQLPLHRSAAVSVAALGVAMMAGLGAGIWRTLDELGGMEATPDIVTPDGNAAATFDRSYVRWLAATDMIAAQSGPSP